MSEPIKNEESSSEEVTYQTIIKTVRDDRKVPFNMLSSMNSYQIKDDQEYHLALFMVQRLAQEMTRYKLRHTPQRVVDHLHDTQPKESKND